MQGTHNTHVQGTCNTRVQGTCNTCVQNTCNTMHRAHVRVVKRICHVCWFMMFKLYSNCRVYTVYRCIWHL